MKTILITGGSGAICQGVAKVLINDGYKVILVGRDLEKLQRTKNELTCREQENIINTYSMDITDEQQVKSIIAKIWKSHQIDGLVHAAGIGEPVDYFTSTEADWQDCIQGKLMGTIRTTREVAKLMEEHNVNGKIVIINGTFCYDPHPDFIINSTVNAALAGFTKAASKYLGNKGICLNTINPWITDSPSWQTTAENLATLHNTQADILNASFKNMNPLKQFTQVEDIGRTIAFLLNDHTRYINGAFINLDGGASIGY